MTTHLSVENPFSMQLHLDRMYAAPAPRFAFGARSLEEYGAWQAGFRAELAQVLGLDVRPPEPTGVDHYASVERDSYVEEHYGLDCGEGVQMPFYLLVPKTGAPFKPILVFHGHDPSAQFCLGNYPDAETARANLLIDNNYAQALAQAGYLVGVVEQRGLGQRLTDQTGGSPRRSCRHLAFSYLMHGRTLLGERIRDGMCALSYLLARTDVRGAPGCTGHSGGGTTALWLSALDPRIAVLVASGCFSSFQASILAMEHCECNYVPGILALAEMGDLAALLAPRPFCAIQGDKDRIFPIQGALEQFPKVCRAYALHHAAGACQLNIHPGGHAYHNGLSQAWFEQWLK